VAGAAPTKSPVRGGGSDKGLRCRGRFGGLGPLETRSGAIVRIGAGFVRVAGLWILEVLNAAPCLTLASPSGLVGKPLPRTRSHRT